MRPENLRKLNRKGERGAATVEFAVIATLLLLLIFGILEIGFVFWQSHYVSNAAREGLRVGVIANNYNCFDGAPSDGCTEATDRYVAVDTAVRDYLDTLYGPEDIASLEILSPESGNDEAETKPLIVTVTVNNFLDTSLIAALVPGYSNPDSITFTATGDYESPQEP